MKIQELLPHLKKGYVAMDKNGTWYRYLNQPILQHLWWQSFIDERGGDVINLSKLLDLDPFDGDWKDSLMKCGEKK